MAKPRRTLAAVAVAAAISCAVTPNAAGAGEYPGLDEHVRSADPKVVAVIREALRQSATFDGLVATLNNSDVVVYVNLSWKMPTGILGYLPHQVSVSGGRRYLRIVVDATLARDELTATMAHELEHAVEVARASDATSNDAIRTLFKRLDSGEGAYGTAETSSAREIHDIVLREIRVQRSMRFSFARASSIR